MRVHGIGLEKGGFVYGWGFRDFILHHYVVTYSTLYEFASAL